MVVTFFWTWLPRSHQPTPQLWHPQLKWMVSSRNWPDIIERLDTATQMAPISLELNEASVSKAVSIFIQHKASQLATVKKYSDKTHDTICRYLLSHSQDTFLWVALVCQQLEKSPRRNFLKNLSAFPSGLDALYGRMISEVRQSEDADFCKQILAIMLTVYRPITLDELSSLIEAPDGVLDDDYDAYKYLSDVIAVCGSFLTLKEDTVVFVHQSAKDFLLQKASNEILPNDIGAEHYQIFTHSLEAMLKILRRDIFNIRLPGLSMKNFRSARPNPLATAQYACVYWVDHLQNSKRDEINALDKGGRVDIFLQQKYLHWLEALSILGSISDGIQAMQKLEILIQEEGDSQDLLNQVYFSPLVFSPTNSLTKKHFQKERPDWVLNNPIVQEDWNACLQTIEGHSKSVNSIAWSQDGTRLASASGDSLVRILDPIIRQGKSLEGHSNWVTFIAWSQEGIRLASASHDDTVRIWDPITGQCVSILKGHSGPVSSIAWSQDGSRLASASYDQTVRIWDPTTGQCVSTLKGHSGSVNSIAWSRDGNRLASGSADHTVRVWDPTTGQSISLEGHSRPVNSISWSQNGTRLASGSANHTVRVWDPTTGQSISTLKGHIRPVIITTWSQDERQLASASMDNIIKIWDLTTDQCVLTLEGHSGHIRDRIRVIAWFEDGSRLASASDDIVRIWDLTTGQCVSTLKEHVYRAGLIAWSRDGSRLASASHNKTVRILDIATAKCVSTLNISFPAFLQSNEGYVSHRHTSVGASNKSVTSNGYGFSDDCSWITYNGVNFLWLPTEYRPIFNSLYAIFNNKLAIGCSSDHVIFLELADQGPITGH
ncbi:hypothetical protein N7486_011088 [Penicillium sp. IBT 16267x]|nr:hypothetical protein N7486_011088 [Penicillium sp. IBT 16267x]